jgi:hypothetical protein
MINKINKKERFSMNATPTRTSGKEPNKYRAGYKA